MQHHRTVSDESYVVLVEDCRIKTGVQLVSVRTSKRCLWSIHPIAEIEIEDSRRQEGDLDTDADEEARREQRHAATGTLLFD